MGNRPSRPVATDQIPLPLPNNLGARVTSFPGLHDDDQHSLEDSQGLVTTSRGSHLCTICLEALSTLSTYGVNKYHWDLLSLENSVASGCHLCSLVRHYLPERPQHQLDECMTLSLRSDVNWAGSLLAGWRHRPVAFNLLSLGQFRKIREFQRSHCDLGSD
jgi:hypothetical protein